MIFESLLQDFRLGLRHFARRPGFAAIALVTLALGIGAPTAIFSVVHAVLLRPLPYPRADRIVQFTMSSRGPGGQVSFAALPVSSALEWAAESAALESLALFNDRAMTLETADGPHRLSGVSATPNLFETLRTAPARGRVFAAGGSDLREIVLSHGTWTKFLGANPGIVDQPITLTLGAVGGAAGIVVAALAVRALVSLAPPELPRLQQVALDRNVLLFAIALTAGIRRRNGGRFPSQSAGFALSVAGCAARAARPAA